MPESRDAAIKIENLSKIFKLPHEKNSSVKSVLVNFHRRGYELQKALENVSFEVKKGEFFGIVGRNGSGKSTLLKLLAGIYKPTKGTIQINGSLAPFIELGVGFNEELTGRENVFLNGALLGFSRSQLRSMYKDIVEFAELERFMDQKLKNYSSGMQVRLAFSIAIRAQSDILLLDEVLAVGDAAFQQKCNDYFAGLRRGDQTIILVSHNMTAIEKYCQRALLLENSRVLEIGESAKIASLYEEILFEEMAEKEDLKAEKEEPVASNGIEVKIETSQGGKVTKSIKAFKDLKFTVRIKSRKPLKNITAGINIRTSEGEIVFAIDTSNHFGLFDLEPATEFKFSVELDNILTNGTYYLNVNLSDEDHLRVYSKRRLTSFTVSGVPRNVAGSLIHPKSKVSKA